MKSFKTFLLEGSRSHKKLLRKISSKRTSPEQIQDLTTANEYRSQSRDITKNIKQNLNSNNKDISIFDYLAKPNSTLVKTNQIGDTIRKKYPGTWEREDPNYKKSFHRTTPGTDSTEFVPHRIFSLIHPELNQSIIKGIKKVQLVDSDKATNFGDLASDIAKATLNIQSPYYISDPRKTRNKIKWRKYFK